MGNKNDDASSTLAQWSDAIALTGRESATKTARGREVREALEARTPLSENAKALMHAVFDHHSEMENLRWHGVAEGAEEAVFQRLTQARILLNELADLSAALLNTDAE